MQSLYEQEYNSLREELHHLKSCQVTFLTFAVTSTGILFGLVLKSAPYPTFGIYYLFPLIVIIPFWWIFFDKATTITRIVGYYRILELLILGKKTSANYRGWENSLEDFRNKQNRNELPKIPKSSLKIVLQRSIHLIIFRTTHRYWLLSFSVFFGISLICIFACVSNINLGVLRYSDKLAIVCSIIITFITALWNIKVVWQLIYGKKSYQNNQMFCENVLQVKDKKSH